VPNVPYAWQKKEDPVLLPSSRSKSISVLGLMSPSCELFYKVCYGAVNSGVMIGFFNSFSETINKKTVVVLDNASVHKSKEFSEKLKHWKEKNLEIYFILPYSPELNFRGHHLVSYLCMH